ncbi:hypothetical protein B0H21DRAFT_818035 [Amylocystis lapponica]|nr:hypothetical protein B0H21DRAFT_818035 [Amylocystis lapponica]
MASGARTRKASTQPEVDATNLNNLERLIFAQAVHELGPEAWPKVCELLAQHPMILRPKHFFTPHSCRVTFTQLMEEARLECPENVKPRSEVLLKLAQRHYGIRLAELKELISAEETKFKTLVTEIDEIRGGLWDDKISGKSTVDPPSREKSPAAVEELIQSVSHPDTVPTALQAQTPVTTDDAPLLVEQEPEAPEVAAEVVPDELPHQTPDGTDSNTNIAPEAEQPIENSMTETAAMDTDQGTGDTTESPTSATPAVEPMETDGTEPEPVAVQGPQSVSPPAETLEPNAEDAAQPTAERGPPQEVPPPALESPAENGSQDKPTDSDIAMTETDPVPTVESEAPRVDNKRKASEVDSVMSESQREKKRAREESEPADDDEAGPSSGPKVRRGRPTTADGNPVVSKRFQNVITMLHSQISQHRFGNVFQYPIKKSEAPDYHDIVKRPMDLKTMKARIKDGLISNSMEFQRDVFLMFANAMMYNRPGSEIYNMAEEMMLSSEAQISAFRQTEGFHRM